MGAPGDQVTLLVSLDTGATTVQGVQVNLDCHCALLGRPVGARGATLPEETWLFASFSPGPGILNLLAVDLSGVGQPISGPIFRAIFTIDAGAPDGDVPVVAVVAEVRDESNGALTLMVVPGVVKVSSLVGP